MGSLLGWLWNFLLLFSVIVCVVGQLIALVDLESDHTNPYDSASLINMFVFPEFLTQGVLCIVYLLTGHWVMFLLSLPYLYHNVRLFLQRRHLVEVTEICNRLDVEKKQRFKKLGYLATLFVFSLSGVILTVSQMEKLGIIAPAEFAHCFSFVGV